MLFAIVLQTAVASILPKVAGALGAAAIAFAASLGIGKLARYVMEASARQPEIAGGLRTTAIIVGALIEGVCLFAVIVCLLVLFR